MGDHRGRCAGDDEEGWHMYRRRWLTAALGAALAVSTAGVSAAGPPAHVPGGPCLEPSQQVRLSSIPSYADVVKQLRSIEASSRGAVEVASAGQSGEGRQLMYATVGDGPDVVWLQARLHGNQPPRTAAAQPVPQH